MKTMLRTLAIMVAALLCFGCNTTKKGALEDKELRKMVIDYGNAMNDLTASSLDFGADTETQWAIDTVNQIWENCQKQPFDFLQYMADIAIMEKYFAYGIAYVPMIMYWSKHYHDPEGPVYKNGFDDTMYYTDSLRQVIRVKGEWRDYFLLHAMTLCLVEMYHVFADDIKETPFQYSFNSIYNIDIIEGIYDKGEKNPSYYAWQIEGASFFNEYCVFIRRTSEDPDVVDDKLIEYAYTMDDYSQPIITAWKNNKPLPVLTASDNESFLRTALPIYTDMLKMLTKRFKEME